MQTVDLYGIENNRTLERLITTFLNSVTEEYTTRFRYDVDRLTGDFRLYLSSRGVCTLWRNEKLYGLISRRIEWLYDLRIEYNQAKQRHGLTDAQLARVFGFNTFRAYYNSGHRNRHIKAFLELSKLLAP